MESSRLIFTRDDKLYFIYLENKYESSYRGEGHMIGRLERSGSYMVPGGWIFCTI